VPKRHFPMVPVMAVILKVIAVIVLVSFLYTAYQAFQQTIENWKGGQAASMFQQAAPAVTKLNDKLMSLLEVFFKIINNLFFPFFLWGFAEFIMMLRETEFNTRVAAGIKEEVAIEDYSAVAPPVTPAADTTDAE